MQTASLFSLFVMRKKAEDAEDPALSLAGEERALRLATLLGDAEISRVLSTDFRRTRHTVKPLVSQQELELELYDHRTLDRLAAALLQNGQNSLVVGHSNTTPELVEALGGEAGEPFDEKTEFDRLYVLSVKDSRVVTTSVLRY